MREISLDTETTGLEAQNGDRVVEIGAVELINGVATSNFFHVYIDPLRPMSAEASDITGITDDMLRGKPKFNEIADGFVDFIANDYLVIHNAAFDIGFLNAEFERIGVPLLTMDRVIDTLGMARKRFPGAQSNLDALCRRFGIDNSAREKHGALLDAELLAEVYLELNGGRQPGFELAAAKQSSQVRKGANAAAASERRPRRSTSRLSEAERVAHLEFVADMGTGAVWTGPKRDG
ncbi:MAG: DNA polymerase III subunit epsilon [Pseudomonadota bacterium]